jgi:hypothetical protein
MSDKMLAGLVTAAVVAPICVVCLGGPAVMAAIGGWASGWFSGFGGAASAGLAIAAAAVAVGFIKRRNRRAGDAATVTRDGPSRLKTMNWDKRSQTK